MHKTAFSLLHLGGGVLYPLFMVMSPSLYWVRPNLQYPLSGRFTTILDHKECLSSSMLSRMMKHLENSLKIHNIFPSCNILERTLPQGVGWGLQQSLGDYLCFCTSKQSVANLCSVDSRKQELCCHWQSSAFFILLSFLLVKLLWAFMQLPCCSF